MDLTNYKILTNVSKNEYSSGFVFGLAPNSWAIFPTLEAERLLTDFPDEFKEMDKAKAEKILADDQYLPGTPYLDPSVQAKLELEVAEKEEVIEEVEKDEVAEEEAPSTKKATGSTKGH